MRPNILNPLFASTETISGVGSRTCFQLKKLLGNRVIDLVLHFPTNITERQFIPTIIKATPGKIVTVNITVKGHQRPFHSKQPYRVQCEDSTGHLDLVFFRSRSDWISKVLPIGAKRIVSGSIESYGKGLQMVHPDYIVSEDKKNSILPIDPIYPLTDGLTSKQLRRFIENAMEILPDLPEWHDISVIQDNAWESWKSSILKAHMPKSEKDLYLNAKWRERLAYDELLANQLAINIRSKEKSKLGHSTTPSKRYRKKVLSNLSFSLTPDQNNALKEIDNDMESKNKMVRLLQGDVGSGKTVVALLAMLNAVESSKQAALMVPTEILAKQHHENFSKFLEETDIKCSLLIGRLTEGNRQKIISKLASGEVSLIIGTHALFQEDVKFNNLGIVVVDEQHRFGVDQRLSLVQKGNDVDILVMTATPIPRTLLLTEYGDMDVSRLNNRPIGRGLVSTKVLPIERLIEVENAIKRAVNKGAKVYWVCPLIENSDNNELGAALERYNNLQSIFDDKVGLIHGKMNGDEKDKVMSSFKNGSLKILVATTVIEVGMDIPDATVIVVEHADRFGLSQLHQLRGRIGRNNKDGTCLLLYKTPLNEYSRERLKIIRQTDDGFEIAEHDLKIRGAGEILGTKQSGFSKLRIADLNSHEELLKLANKQAKEIIESRELETKSERSEALKLLLNLFERDQAESNLRAG
tara:strand:- start:529 stop:2610 length:2082 start_codon:yes stop_codon:yes gene_type:complete